MLGLYAEEKMQNSTKDDLPAIIAAAQEDPAAFGRLYDRYVQPIYRYLFSRLGMPMRQKMSLRRRSLQHMRHCQNTVNADSSRRGCFESPRAR